jgi:hypothetical protein
VAYRTLAAALALAAVLALAGCAQKPTARYGKIASLTTATARQVFDSYASASDRATAAGDRAAALALTEGVQWTQVSANFLIAGQHRAMLHRYRYGTPVFYLPEPAGYPRWFVASVARSTTGGTGLAGLPVAANGRVLMLFTQASATARWLLASTAQLAPGAAVPALATDASGYAQALPMSTATLLARPDVTGPLQATVVDDGPASAAARAVASGPLTTGLYAARAALASQRTPRGDVGQWQLQGSNYARFALRTANGGALVLYAMYLNTITEVPAALNQSYPVSPGPEISVPAEFAPFLKPGTPAPRVQLITQMALAFAAIDPPPGTAKIQVIAVGGGPSYASAS